MQYKPGDRHACQNWDRETVWARHGERVAWRSREKDYNAGWSSSDHEAAQNLDMQFYPVM